MFVLDTIAFSDESTMVQNFLNISETFSSENRVLAGIVFTRVPSMCRGMPVCNLEYKLRFPSTLRSAQEKFSMSPFANVDHWMTQYMFPVFQRVGPRKALRSQGGPPGRGGALLKMIHIDLCKCNQLFVTVYYDGNPTLIYAVGIFSSFLGSDSST